MRIHSLTGYSVCMRAQPLQLFHCTNPSLCRCVCWQVSPGKLEKKIQIISLHTMGTRLMPKIVGEHTLLIFFFFRAKTLESKALASSNMDCLPECLQVWYAEVRAGGPTSHCWPPPRAYCPPGASRTSRAGGPSSQFIVLLSCRLSSLKRRDVCC